MSKFLAYENQKFANFLFHIVCISLIVFISGCGSADYSSPGTGSIAFNVEWRDAPNIKSTEISIKAILSCEDVSVETIVADVYDESDSFLVSGGPWLCSAHQGTVYNIPVGSNRKFIVLGKDINENVIYRGEQSVISISAGQETNVGTIVLEPHNPSLDAPSLTTPEDDVTLTSGSPTFEWNSVTGASAYLIIVSTNINFSSTEINENVTTASYTSNTTLSNGTYYWRVKAKDSESNESAWSEIWSYTINTTGQTAPVATITSPEDNSTYSEGDNIAFSGTGEDAEDGTLSGSSLVWTSSIDSQIGTGTSFTRNDLSVGIHTITLTVIDSNSATDSDSVSITINQITSAPSAPTGVSASSGDGKATIFWDNVSGATSYNIYWATSSGVTIDTGTKISDVTSPYVHTGLNNDTTYYYIITAENTYGESTESSDVNATPVHSWTMLKLPDTEQTKCYNNSAEITCPLSGESFYGQDANYTINPPSYTDNGNGTVTDNVTGLIWQQEDDDITRIWDDAISYCNDLTLAGYSDWRLPSIKELLSIVDYGTYYPLIDATYFPGTNESRYWSSTTQDAYTSYACQVSFISGFSDHRFPSDYQYVRCMRGGQ